MNDLDFYDDAFSGKLALTLSGDYANGGVVKLQLAGQPIEHVELPATEWAVLAELAHAALKAPPFSIESFLTAAVLAKNLNRLGVIGLPVATSATQIVYRLRNRLENSKTAARLVAAGDVAETRAFAEHLVQRSSIHGYHLGLTPAHVVLNVTS